MLLVRRDEQDIWKGLYAPLLIEQKSSRAPSKNVIETLVNRSVGHKSFEMLSSSKTSRQILSHQTINGRYYHISLEKAPRNLTDGMMWVDSGEETYSSVGRPKMIVEMMRQLF